MAIRVIKKGDIECDFCKKKLADIKLSEQLLKCFLEEQRFLTIWCVECSEKENPPTHNE